MWEPVGPLPPSVYWRRRGAAVAAAATVVVLLGFVLAAFGGPTDRPTTTAANAVTPVPAVSASPGSGVPGPGATDPQALGAPVGDASLPGGLAGVPSTTPSGTVGAESAPAAAGPPAQCDKSTLAVTGEVDPPQHRVGQKPVFRLVLVNAGTVPCVRDLDSALQEMEVQSADGSQRVWSSNDCFDGRTTDVRTLAPGERIAFSLTWAGRTSAPGCPAGRQAVPAGDYRLVVRLDDLAGAPTPFTRLP